ncbi:4-hydroxythreonine-4-phosphate dehydrogenase PdxA [Georgenia sp. TF02-10]|uniref:4-hydroxythreonine-4-phosphate dehydrogenase PdxA n=1 Tax=Georgenia sp. TF02-10 TaxID=2917725 RepID=UPI001FA750AB|nr:4-hydroxythreonine-4-phosphate dehydrogenase PdxA [Georgenia sp. TF02-10]UNX54980.1 4-hydroxythreonine-4-phosphate dehydrogenase PdxA [Georgenia sp. TF02-10]
MASPQSRPVLALTVGDPVGIGPEITLQTLAEFSGDDAHHGIAVGDLGALERAREALDLDVELRPVASWDTTPGGDGVVDVFDIGVLGDSLPDWGVVDERAGRAAVTAIEVATRAALDNEISGIVTGPINKEAIWAAGSEHLGHTEMLGALTGVTKQDTMFVVRNAHVPGHHLRIFFATRHLSLRQALDRITRETQLASIVRAATALRVFGVTEPRLAVAAINPHGGENGAFGDEEIVHLAPAVEDARARGLDVAGPIPADSVFHHGLVGRYDGILSQYHDQGHIAAKTVDFDGTISVTVGLPILRTSVDHGTAFDIAGTGKADHGTMRSAYLAAVEYSPFVDAIRAEYSPAVAG